MENRTRPPRNDGRLSLGKRRFIMLAGVGFMLAATLIILWRLYTIQVRDYTKYKVLAVEQQVSDTTIPAVRGAIYDSDGKTLARSTIVWNVVCDPSMTDASIAYEAADKITQLLGEGADREMIYSRLTASNKYQVLAQKVEKPVADAIKEYAAALNKEQSKTVIYISLEQSATREYPYGAYLSAVLGFCGSNGGAYGLERYYNDILSGTDGRSLAEENALGYQMENGEGSIFEAVDGDNLHLTIKGYVQSVAQEYLDAAVKRYNVQNRGCAIVMNVNTAEIYALATSDNYDPNVPYEFQESCFNEAMASKDNLSYAQIARLQNRLGSKTVIHTEGEGKDKREFTVSDVLADGVIQDIPDESNDEYSWMLGAMREAQWRNKAVTELYSPGSVYKVITSAAGLDSGKLTAQSSFYCGGYLPVADHTYRCADYDTKGTQHAWEDMATALQNSCNVYYIQAGQTMGARTLYDYFKAFGFTETTGVDLPYETPWMSYYTDQNMGATELASTSFGQAQAITPMQMCAAICAAVNGGYLVTPHIVDYITDSSGNVVKTTETTVKRQVISEEVSAQIRDMMNFVMMGSGKNAQVPGYLMGGKSGTTEQLHQEKRDDGDYKKVSSFVSVLPINDPEILVYVMLDDPRSYNDYASQIVAPVVGNIVSEIAPYLGLETDNSTMITGNVRVPYLLEYDASAAQAKLNQTGFEHRVMGSGSTVLQQYPYAGTTAPAGSIVYLYTESDTMSTTYVPNVVGQTATAAKQLLAANNLNSDTPGGNAVVQSQSPEAGSQVPMGTIIALEVVDTSTGE